MRTKTLALIGNGMGTCRLLDELVQRGATSRYDIVVYGEERGGAYNRIMLGKVLAGEPVASITTKPPDWYERHGIRLVDDTRVTRLDTTRKLLETARGDAQRYDVAVLATGSQPLVPPLAGMTAEGGELRPGVFVYRTVDDGLRMYRYLRPGDSAVVIGGGLLGLEAAKVLSDQGLHVTVVHVAGTLLNAQLDMLGGEMLEKQIARAGVFVRTGRTVDGIVGDEQVEAVTLDDGTTLPADMVVVACGVRPRVDLARSSGLPVNKGIIVNDTLATELPGVYAFGECAEHAGRTYGIVAPVWEQAEVLANVLTGAKPNARYRGSKLYTRLKVAGVDVASMGILEPELESDEVLQIVEERKHAYRKLVLRGGRLAGAMLVGDTRAAATLVQLFDRGDPLPDNPLEALCAGLTAAASAERTVCNCHKLSERALCEAITSGADSVESLGAATRAGTGCGSCKSELVELVARHRRAPAISVAG
jgi:nitrite reductase (NADH) large subunit